jgi:hypothetical protein
MTSFQRMDQPTTSKRSSAAAILLFATSWCTLVAFFDTMAITGVLNQWHAHRTYTPINATVLESSIREEDGEDGTAYIPVIRYEYTANGQRHESDRLRWGQLPTGRRTAHRIVAEHPPAKPIQAWIDPTNPARSVLFPKLKGADVTLIVFLVPFNAIGALLLCAGVATLLGRPSPLAPQGETAWRPQSRLTSAIAALLGVPAIICFIASFVFAFGWGFNPPLEAPLAVLAASAVLCVWAAARALAGAHATTLTPERIAIPEDQAHHALHP